MTVYLLRHGVTAWNEQRRYQGRSDVPLSPAGRTALHKADLCPARVWVSPLLRARQTAEILFPGAEQMPVPDLREMDFGAFEGRTADEMAADTAYRAWVDGGCTGPTPGGEDMAGFCARTCAAFAGLVRQCGEKELVIVAHGGTQMAVLSRFARPERAFYQWQSAPGGGFVLAVQRQPLLLHLQGTVSYAKETS